MSGAELGLAVVATLDLCLKNGSKLIRFCRSVKDAEAELAELVIYIENHWKRTSMQVDFLRRVWTNLDTDYQSILHRTLQMLVNKLSFAITRIDGLIAQDKASPTAATGQRQLSFSVKKWKYGMRKDELNRIIKDLDGWQKMFDPSWFMILMMSNSQIDTELLDRRKATGSSLVTSAQTLRNTIRGVGEGPSVSVALPEDGLDSASIVDIPFCSCQVAQRAGSSKLFVLNSVSARASYQQLSEDIRELATRLYRAEPRDFGLLQCSGFIRHTNTQPTKTPNMRKKDFTLVFKMLPGYAMPQSLRSRLLAADPSHSLTDRLDIAKQLARSVSSVHTFGFVHKNICPENILLVIPNPTSTAPQPSSMSPPTTGLGRPFLVGFEEFRSVGDGTLRVGDSKWEKDLYRHPGRQGATPWQYYIMQHDIYSLGVCLLELGLWESFVIYEGAGSSGSGDQCVLSKTLVAFSDELLFTWQPELVKDILVRMANTLLPTRMGSKYAAVVETCLTCLDEGNPLFGDQSEFHDADDVGVGVRYLEKILLQLDNISI